MDTNDLTPKIRQRHGRTIGKLLLKALGEPGTNTGIERTGGVPPRVHARSLVDPDTELSVFASHIQTEEDPSFVGKYPPGARIVLVSISAHHVRTRAVVHANPDETDAWGQALTPDGFEDFTLKLGRIASSPSGAVHYRHILGPDGHVCAIDPRDEHTMKTSATFI